MRSLICVSVRNPTFGECDEALRHCRATLCRSTDHEHRVISSDGAEHGGPRCPVERRGKQLRATGRGLDDGKVCRRFCRDQELLAQPREPRREAIAGGGLVVFWYG